MDKTHFEETESKEFDWKLTKRLLSFVKPFARYFYFALLLMLITTILAPLRPYLSKVIIDDYILQSNTTGFFTLILLIFLVLISHSILQFLATYSMKWLGQKALFIIRTKVFQHLQGLDVSYFDKNPVGRLVTRVTNDIETISDFLSGGFIIILTDFILILAIIAFMLYLNIKLTLITLSILPILFLITWIFRNRIREIFREIRKSIANINAFLNEFFTGVLTIKVFNRENYFKQRFRKINEENRNLWIKTVHYYSIFFPTIEFLGSLALALIIWFTAESVLSKLMTLGTFFAFIQYSEMFFRPIRDLTEKFTNLQNAMASSERIFQVLDTQPKIVVETNCISFSGFRKSIEFRNITFSYDGNNNVLKDVSFEVEKGEIIAIVGHTGAGKTTIVNLLCRFYEPQSGEILIDGVDLRRYDINDLRSKIAYITQDVFLFARTVVENISLGDEKIDFQKIVEVSETIGLSKFVENLPTKYDTNILERGINLSAGQRQLLAFARALVRDPEILILDEATSNIDPETEKIIEQSLNTLFAGRTSIVIAHRFTTINRANRIVVLHKGELREIGTHTELMKLNGIYSKLYKLQVEKQKLVRMEVPS
ncbi:MAG: ABC transporter ATP-binding protein/permease [Ignavibacteria bacterium]|nr:ABC transporter ATP-binding protein/permease [Ignavibacteria bacterium]